MARWRLTAPHYLYVLGTKYRYEETDRDTGELNRQEFDVPRFLDPAAPRDCRSPEGCVVAYEGKSFGRDWVFRGEPTPDMEPLDDEARAISDGLAPKWSHPIDSLPAAGGFGEALLAKLSSQLDAAFAKGGTIQPVSTKGVDPEAFAELQSQVASLMARNAELEAAKAPTRRA